MVFIHRRIRFHRSHARATIPSTTVRVDSPGGRSQYTLRIITIQKPRLRLTDLIPGSRLLEAGVRPLVDAVPAVVTRDGLLQTVTVVEIARARRGNGDLSMMGSDGRIGDAQQTAPFFDRGIRIGVVMMLIMMLVPYPYHVRIHIVRGILLLRHHAHLAHAAALLADHALQTNTVAVRVRLGRNRVVAVVAVDAAVAVRGIHDGMAICQIEEGLDRVDCIPMKSLRPIDVQRA